MIDKILHIMKGPKGVLTMCIVSFTESIFFIIPPDPFLALLCIKKKISELCKFTLLCTFYSVLGGCIAYYLGDQIVSLSQKYDIKLINKYINDIESLKLKIDNQTFIMMLTSAFTPLPFKIFCISAGAINVNFVGQVNFPGVYAIHPFSNAITGLIQSGGIDTTGSLRSITIKRNRT